MTATATSDRYQSTIADAEDRVRTETPGSPEWRDAERAAIAARRAFWDEMRRTWHPPYKASPTRGPR